MSLHDYKYNMGHHCYYIRITGASQGTNDCHMVQDDNNVCTQNFPRLTENLHDQGQLERIISATMM